MKEASYKLFFKAFSNSTRFRIIQLLRKGPKNVSQICEDLKFEQSRVSHNLKCLLATGFVRCEWDGKNKIYSLDSKYIIPILNNMEKHIDKYNERLEKCGVLHGNKDCNIVEEV